MLFFLSLQKDDNLLSKLRLWVCSGEQLAVSLAQEFFKSVRHPKPILCNFYGSTEVMGDVTYYICDGLNCLKDADKVPIGIKSINAIITNFMFTN